MALKYDDRGLIPAIIQDDDSGEVLTLFWMNDEAVRQTAESRQVWRYSREHQKLMRKGETSGNYLNVRRVLYDCDEDALVVRVQPTGPACHTGERSCFYRELGVPQSDSSRGGVASVLPSASAATFDATRSSTPSRYNTSWSALIATSACASSGCRVVRDWSASFGHISTRVTGLDSKAPPTRIISYASAAISGIKTMRDKRRSQMSGSPTSPNTTILTTTTVSRKLVPQRTCAVE